MTIARTEPSLLRKSKETRFQFMLGLPSSVTNKVYPDARDIRDQCGTPCECWRKADPIITGADGDLPTEATGETRAIRPHSQHVALYRGMDVCVYFHSERKVGADMYYRPRLIV